MKLMITVLMLTVCATGAMAQISASYGWEDGIGTALGTYGNVGELVNVNDFSHTGSHSLYMTEDPLSSTPQVFLAWVHGVQTGDEVTVSWWSYDDTPGAVSPDYYPRSRVWGHYSSDDITTYEGSASGGADYTTGIGWEEQTHTFVCDLVDPDATALVIEFRLYSGTSALGDPLNYFWADDITVTAPEGTTIFLPNQEPVGTTETTTMDGVKALYR